MAKKKSDKTSITMANVLVLIMAAGVILSMFFKYYKMVLLGATVDAGSPTGWSIYESDGDGDLKTYITFSLILSVAVAAVAILRLIKFPFFRTTLFSIIYICGTVAMIVFAILTMVTLKDATFTAGILGEGKLGIGIILNLVFSGIAALGALCSYLFARK